MANVKTSNPTPNFDLGSIVNVRPARLMGDDFLCVAVKVTRTIVNSCSVRNLASTNGSKPFHHHTSIAITSTTDKSLAPDHEEPTVVLASVNGNK